VAPHPFFPGPTSLNGYLLKNLNLFDALEYSHFYSPMINFNQEAVKLSQSFGLPLVGTSDAHLFSQIGSTYTLIYAEKNLEAVFAAIRQNRVKVISRPLKHLEMGWIAIRLFKMRLPSIIVKPWEEKILFRISPQPQILDLSDSNQACHFFENSAR